MPIMSDASKKKVSELFTKDLRQSLEILLFHAQEVGVEEPYAEAAREILTDLALLSEGRLSFREVNMNADPQQAAAYGIDKSPALVFLNDQGVDQNFRFYGAPVGYEFMALLEDIVDVSRKETRLSPTGRAQIQAVQEEVLIQVFSTPG